MPRRPKLRKAELEATQRAPVLDETSAKLMAALPSLMDIWIREAQGGNSQAAMTLLRLAEQLLATASDNKGLALLEEIRKLRAQAARNYQ